ncbi:hypothetical protein KIN20_030321 [Parelaphostrongylus tenuis]|uniref:Uncharacterized protein n=1 Tax=Parelaphostrongylus tenuis TaxID=148309 RepID=A0AAD5R4M2_PARTN|nr:hypothetical protein KIN20_030321 [Parelaphostrongylus tenuis]
MRFHQEYTSTRRQEGNGTGTSQENNNCLTHEVDVIEKASELTLSTGVTKVFD